MNPKPGGRESISTGAQGQKVDVREEGELWDPLDLDKDRWEASDGDSPFHF